jgi:transcriptional regulator with XRE-family HTH domain
MPRRIAAPKGSVQRHFIKEWRKRRGLTQDQLAERIGTTKATVSRIENYQQAALDPFLLLCADALQTDVPSLRMRDPSQEDAIWSIWEGATPNERETITEIAKTIVKRRSA